MPAPESARHSDIDLSDAALPIGPILEAAFLEHGAGTLTVVIADDGDGFEPEHRALTPGSGMGLLCMEERARLLDGTVRVQSAPGQGTVVEATLPVSPPGRVGSGLESAADTPEGRR